MKALLHLNKYFYKYRLRLFWGILFVAISNLFAIFPAQVIRQALDLVAETAQVYRLFDKANQQIALYEVFASALLIFGIIVVTMALLKGIFMFFMRQTIIVMSRLIEYDLKNEIFAHYQSLSLSFYRRNNTGDLMARISEDVSRVRMYIGPAIMYTINLLVLFILVVAAMIHVSPMLTLYVLLPLPVLSFSIYYVSNIINHKSERVQAKLSDLSTFTQEAFSGIRVLKAFTREKASLAQFDAESADYRNKSLDLVKTNALFAPIMLLLIGLSTLITVYFGGRAAIAGEITAGNIAEFIIYVNMLTWPVASVGWVTSLVQRAAASQERINEFLQIPSDIVSSTDEPTEIKGNIEFKNVSLVYPDSGIKALDNVSFSVEPGRSLGIMGKTGAGKSTIAALIARMYDATTGEISIDGQPITQLHLDSLRSEVGYVPQDVFLFSETIANNIAFGLKGNIENGLVEQAAKDAVIYDNIMEFPDGLQTMVGERGITLSGGQKQRISIARAIIKNPKILLFDDCLSAVDTQTEEKILQNLRRIMMGRTSIIISHRVSSVKNADHIIFIENGGITEQGTHESLIEQKGQYADLFEKQLLEEETA